MGEPAQPTEAERRETRELAARIVESVRADEPMPLPEDVEDAIVVSLDERMTAAVKDLYFRLAQEIELLRAERDAYAETFNLACRLQDADQCEDHATGDDCEQGEIEHQFYEHLSRVRTDDSRTDPIERGDKKRAPARASEKQHVLNDVEECVSWCPACRENRSRGLNPDGTAKQ